MILKMYRYLAVIIIAISSISVATAQSKYNTDISKLPPQYKKAYPALVKLINTGEIKHKPVIERELARITKGQPNFLPIYIQRVRFNTNFYFHPFANRKNTWEKSENLLKEIIKKDPKYFKTYGLFTFIYLSQNKFKKARQMNEIGLKLNSSDPWMTMYSAKLKAREGKIEQAKDIITKLLIENIKDSRITSHAIRTILFIANQSNTKVITEVYSKLLLDLTFTKDELIDFTQSALAEADSNRQYYLASYVLIDYLIKLDKDYIPTQFIIVDFYRVVGYQYSQGLIPKYSKKASAAIKTILLTIKRKESKNKRVYSYLAEHYFSEENAKGMMGILNESMKLGYSADPDIEIMGAHFWVYQRLYDKAIPIYKRIIKRKAENLNRAESGLLFVYANTGKLAAADKIYLSKIKRTPGDAYHYGNYAIFLMMMMGDYDKAIIYSQKARQISDYGLARKVLATAYYAKWAVSLKQGKKAEAYFTKANELLPNISDVKSYCGKYCDQIDAAYEKKYKYK